MNEEKVEQNSNNGNSLVERELQRIKTEALIIDPNDNTIENYITLLKGVYNATVLLTEYQSYHVTAQMVETLLLQLPLTPLTGEDDEWVDSANPEWLSNVRCHYVIKNKSTGKVYMTSTGEYDESIAMLIEEFPAMPRQDGILYPNRRNPAT
jgi:hypothetical protein